MSISSVSCFGEKMVKRASLHPHPHQHEGCTHPHSHLDEKREKRKERKRVNFVLRVSQGVGEFSPSVINGPHMMSICHGRLWDPLAILFGSLSLSLSLFFSFPSFFLLQCFPSTSHKSHWQVDQM